MIPQLWCFSLLVCEFLFSLHAVGSPTGHAAAPWGEEAASAALSAPQAVTGCMQRLLQPPAGQTEEIPFPREYFPGVVLQVPCIVLVLGWTLGFVFT